MKEKERVYDISKAITMFQLFKKLQNDKHMEMKKKQNYVIKQVPLQPGATGFVKQMYCWPRQ